ncbi:MAG: sulfotransferase [Steroidobacteraceae bacterium]
MNRAEGNELVQWQREAERALNAREYRLAHELCLKILTRRPDSADAFFLLAMIAAAHDNFLKAAELIERSLRIDPGNPEYHAQLGRCLIALQRPREAFEAAVRALSLDPHGALTLDTIGVVMTRAGAHAEALDPFRRAVAADATKAPYFYNLGASLQFTGDFTAAADAYRKALVVDPFYYRAWSSLAQVSRIPFTDAEVAQLNALLDEQSLDPDSELHLCHALAKQCEDVGRYGESFAYLERGKRRKREAIHYAFESDRALFSAAKRPIATRANARPGSCDSHEPIFIVGMPRTGTTLVERILSSHPAVFAAGELTNLALALKREARTSSRLVLDPETLAAAETVDLARVGSEYVASTRPRTGHTPHFIDKMPLNFFYAGLIHRALPNAKIICLRRNPLDTALSNYRQLFATSFSYYNYAYDLLDAGRYFIEFDVLAKHWLQTIPGNYCEVHYESVVADTESEARRLVAFCGLDWDPACLAFEQNAAPVATASSVQVRQPIYRTAVERWRKYERELEPLKALLAAAGLVLN